MREHLLTHKAMLLRICARQRLASQIQTRSFEESFHRGTVLRFDVSGCILWGGGDQSHTDHEKNSNRK